MRRTPDDHGASHTPNAVEIAASEQAERYTNSRRDFLTSVALGGAAALVAPATPAGAEDVSTSAAAARPLTPPNAAVMAAELLPPAESLYVGRTGSDYIVDAIKGLAIPYATILPGASFRGIHESLINYGGNQNPELLTCLHEEIAIALAHGYAKATSRPLLALIDGAVGLQHAAMAFYNAWCDRVPLIALCGNHLDASQRRTI